MEKHTAQKVTAEMRDQSVPCVNATYYEVKRDKHMTWNDDRVCTVCKRVSDTFASRRALNESPEEKTV